MIEIDKNISNYVKSLNGLYLRYSDDFIIILSDEFNLDIDIIYNLMNLGNGSSLVEIEKNKT